MSLKLAVFVFCAITFLDGISGQGLNIGNGTLVSISRQVDMNTCASRQTTGLICESDCRLLSRCVNNGGQWNSLPIKLCDEGTYCNEVAGDCTSTPGLCTPGGGGTGSTGDFSCTSQGIFPDPHSCTLYHACFVVEEQLVGFSIRCPSGSAFDPAVNDCTLDLTHDVCRTQQFSCNTVGQMGAWPRNAQIFYICISNNGVRFPVLYRCGRDEIFSVQEGKCVANNGNGNGNGNGSGFTCPSQGLFPHPTDCRSYFFCNIRREAQLVTCPGGTHFNRQLNRCVVGNC